MSSNHQKLAIHGGNAVRESLLGYGHQSIEECDIEAVVKVLESDYLTCGPTTEKFEEKISLITEADFATAVSNGTAALHVACLAAGIKPGDEVIVSPITFAASANCILYCGATPVFGDINPKTWNISPESICSLITKQTKAVIGVDFGGVSIEHDQIRQICKDNDLILIEDAAHALGSKYKGKAVGSLADITTFSFHPVKTITTGEGGAITTNSPKIAERIKLFAKHGITREEDLFTKKDEGGWYYEQLVLGYNYRISDIQAALGLSQLERLSTFAQRRRDIVSFYEREFSDIPEVSSQVDSSPQETVRHLYCIRFDLDALGVSRKFIYDALRAEGIGVNVHYIPVFNLPYYKELGFEKSTNAPEAESYYNEAITLPLHCLMTDNDAADVVIAVKKVIKWCRSVKL